MNMDQMVDAMRKAIDGTGQVYTTDYCEPSTRYLQEDKKFFVVDAHTGMRYFVKVMDEPYIQSMPRSPTFYDGRY